MHIILIKGQEDIDERVKDLTTFLENLPTHNANRYSDYTYIIHITHRGVFHFEEPDNFSLIE